MGLYSYFSSARGATNVRTDTGEAPSEIGVTFSYGSGAPMNGLSQELWRGTQFPSTLLNLPSSRTNLPSGHGVARSTYSSTRNRFVSEFGSKPRSARA